VACYRVNLECSVAEIKYFVDSLIADCSSLCCVFGTFPFPSPNSIYTTQLGLCTPVFLLHSLLFLNGSCSGTYHFFAHISHFSYFMQVIIKVRKRKIILAINDLAKINCLRFFFFFFFFCILSLFSNVPFFLLLY